jgi:hypothetical protein
MHKSIYSCNANPQCFKGAKDNKAAYALLAEDAARLVLDIHDIVKLLDPKNLPQDLVNDLHPFIEYAI